MTPITFPTQPSSLASNPLQEAYSEINGQGINSLGRTVTIYNNENKKSQKSKAFSSIKSIPRKISIYSRAAYKITSLAYYLVKHKVFGVTFTSQHLKSYLENLGPVYGKLLQNVGIGQQLINNLANNLGTTEEEKEKFNSVIRDVLDNNPEISTDTAQSILNQAGYSGYTVKKHLATGTIASCFEIEKDGQSYVAKVVPSWKADEIAAGLKSLRALFCLFPEEVKNSVKELTDPFLAECNLREEKFYQQKFSQTLSGDNAVRLDLPFIPPITLTYKAPELSKSASEADNLLIMEKIENGFTLNQLTNPANRPIRKQVFETCFGIPFKPEYDGLFLMGLRRVEGMIRRKWHDLIFNHGLVHGDLHSGNMMLSFQPGGNISAWFIDFGNCTEISAEQQQQYPQVVNLINSLAAPFTGEDFNDNDLDELTDLLWSDIAIKHENNTDDAKQRLKDDLKTKCHYFRDPHTAIDQFTFMTAAQKRQMKANLHDPEVQDTVKTLAVSVMVTMLSSLCHQHRVHLPPTFTRYIAAHYRAGWLSGVVMD